eukprot:scaffold48_cov395-Prasinococcus_capsulatus_cf.AAC.20
MQPRSLARETAGTKRSGPTARRLAPTSPGPLMDALYSPLGPLQGRREWLTAELHARVSPRRFRDVVVIIPDFESGHAGSNPAGTLPPDRVQVDRSADADIACHAPCLRFLLPPACPVMGGHRVGARGLPAP